jgi:hypothetical protein
MAVNKTKRYVHPAQLMRSRLHKNPTELQPVRAHVYQTIAEMNGGLEHAIQGLKVLQSIHFLSKKLNGVSNLICRIRAQVNRELMTVLNEREQANEVHFSAISGRTVKRRDAPNSNTDRPAI